MVKTARIASGFDVVHIHSGVDWKRLDFLLIKFIYRIPTVVHYHGSDVRLNLATAYQDFLDAKIVATPDLLRWMPDAIFVPNPIRPFPYSFDTNSRTTVIHMPTNRKFKGTALILDAVEELKKEGLDFDFKLIEGVSHKRAMEELSKSHILIDQVVDEKETGIPGLFGMVSLEAMAMGKAVICHVDPEMLKYYPNCPIFNVEVNKEDLKDKIRCLVENLEFTRSLGLKGVQYTRAFHNPTEIAKRLIEIYEKILKS